MDILKTQNMIDETQYWDARILDFNIRYFGDEIEILVESNEKDFCWLISFESCYQMEYKTDSEWRKKPTCVKDMKNGQLGYFGQNILVTESKINGFFEIHLDLTLIEANIICRYITVKRCSYDENALFWKKQKVDALE